jgi:GNAT superfamily N-acetyltransferase
MHERSSYATLERGTQVEYDATTLECAAKTFRSDMWRTVCEDAVVECGIEEACFGPVQATVFEVLPEASSLNVVLGAAEPGAVEHGHLAAAVQWMDRFDVDYRVPVARERPGMAAAEDWLNRHGFEQGRGLLKYVRDASPPEHPGDRAITVWEIGEREADGETMVFDVAPALGLPPKAASLLFSLPVQEHWRTFTAELEGRVVSFGSMLFHWDVAWVGLDATVESARGHGCHQALLRERILAASDAGCRTIVAELDEGYSEGIAVAGRNLLRAGFLPSYRSMNWRRPGG